MLANDWTGKVLLFATATVTLAYWWLLIWLTGLAFGVAGMVATSFCILLALAAASLCMSASMADARMEQMKEPRML